MALNPAARYPGQTNAPNAAYPYGSAKNILVTGDGTGTPWEEAIPNDMWGFFQALLADVGETPTGDPDEVGASQYLDAINTKLAPKAIAPVTSADNSIPRMNGTDQKTLQSSGVLITDANEVTYATPPSRRVVFGLPTVMDGFALAGGADNPASSGSGDTVVFDLATLPDGATVTAVRFLVVPSGTGIMTGALVQRTGRNFTTPNAGTDSTVATSTLAGPATTVTVIALTGLTAAVDKTNGKSLYAQLTADAATQYCFGIAVDFTDPGPRNF